MLAKGHHSRHVVPLGVQKIAFPHFLGWHKNQLGKKQSRETKGNKLFHLA